MQGVPNLRQLTKIKLLDNVLGSWVSPDTIRIVDSVSCRD